MEGRCRPPADIGGLDDGRGQREGIVLAQVLGSALRRQEQVASADEPSQPAFLHETLDYVACAAFRAKELDGFGGRDRMAPLLAECQDELRFPRPEGCESAYS